MLSLGETTNSAKRSMNVQRKESDGKRPRLQETECEGVTSPKHLKSSSDFDFRERIEGYKWVETYNKRCLGVRFQQATSAFTRGKATFHYKDLRTDEKTLEEYRFLDDKEHMAIPEFIQTLKKVTEETGNLNFELIDVMTIPYWAKLLKFMREIEMYYSIPTSSDEKERQKIKYTCIENAELDEDQGDLVAAFLTAMSTDFTYGDARAFLYDLITQVAKTLPERKLLVRQPELNDSTTSQIEKEVFSSPRSSLEYGSPMASPCASDVSPLVSPDNPFHRKIPAVQVQLKGGPGEFALVVGTQRSEDKIEDGEEQNLEQMLTKFFFQDIIFGVTISSWGFSVQALTKDGCKPESGDTMRNIYLYRSNFVKFWKYFPEKNKFNVDKFKDMITFIYSVLHWSVQTKCRLYK